MHFMPDTEDEDSAAETFWPEGYKQVIREDVRRVVAEQLNDRKQLRRVYRKGYAERFAGYEQFLDRVADMVTIGAENGADDAFDEIVDAFLEEDALPETRRYTSYLWPDPLPREVGERLRRVIVDEYGEDDVYRFTYKVGYKDDFSSYNEYMDYIAELVMTGVMNGANDTLERIYRSFADYERLLPVRRYPRRLRMW
jgi:(2Fe-2S) ferredoxin